MNFASEIAALFWEFHLAVAHRIEVELRRFTAATEQFVFQLLQDGMPSDWREQLSAHLAHWEQVRPGYVVRNREILEAYIVEWAKAQGIAVDMANWRLSDREVGREPTVNVAANDDTEGKKLTFPTKLGWFEVDGDFSRSQVIDALYLAAQVMHKDDQAEQVLNTIKGYYKSLVNDALVIVHELAFDPGYAQRAIHSLEAKHRALVNESTRIQTRFLDHGYGRIRWHGYFGDDRANFGGVGLQGAKRILLGTRYRGDLQNVTVDTVVTAISVVSLARFIVSVGLARIAAAPAQSAVVTGIEVASSSTPLKMEAAEILRKVTEQELRALTDDLSRATEVLMRREIIASADGRVARMNFGKALERLVATRVQNSPELAKLFHYKGRSAGPDFIGLGRYQGITLDITTARQAASHLARPYGEDLIVITYQRPITFP